MSFFSAQNRDALTVDGSAVTRGRAVNFIEAFEASWDAQVRGASMFGIQEAMRELDDRQRDAMRKAGLEDVPSLSSRADDPLRAFTDFGYDYLDAARFFENGGTPEMAQRLSEYDSKIEDIRKRYPDLNVMTSAEMWGNVKQKAQAAEEHVSTMRNADFMAPVGSFVGGMAASMNPNTDPLNFATLPVGGFGKSVGVRIATQGGAQGVIEGANQLLGVQEQRQLLGLDHGFADAAMRIGGAFVGGAVVQGAGEAVGFGVRKFLRAPPTKLDPLPPQAPAVIQAEPPAPLPVADPRPGVPPDMDVATAKLLEFPESFDDYVHAASPTRATRLGRGRTNIDIAHVEQQLAAWDGPLPAEMQPKMDTATVRDLNDFTSIPALERVTRNANVDTLARRADPETVGRYETLAAEKQAYRVRLDSATKDRDRIAAASTELDEIAEQIAVLEHKASKAGAMKAKKYRKQLEDLMTLQRDKAAEIAKAETPEMRVIRQRMMEIDERMRDLAEPLSRAYARARGKWAATEADHAEIIKMMRDGRTENRADDVDEFLPRVPVLEERVPLMQQRDTVPDLKQDADAADVVAAVLAKNAETMSVAYDAAKAEIARVLKPEAKNEDGTPANTITLPGYKTPLHLDNDHVILETATGEPERVTVREMLQRQLDAEEDLAAVTSCSIVSTSKSA